MIRFEKVNKTYDKTTFVLRDFDIKIDDGEFVFLMGPSGAGKTTFTKLLLREEMASSGRIFIGKNGSETRVDNLPRRKIPFLRRRMGFIFQDFRLFEKKTVYENVAFAMEILGEPTSEIKKKVPLALEIVGLTGKENYLPAMLSGGQQQRLCVARAIVNSPDVIVADEPTGNLDPNLAKEIMDLLIKINRFKKTVIVVTHAAELVAQYDERVLTISDGRLTSDEKAGTHPKDIAEYTRLLKSRIGECPCEDIAAKAESIAAKAISAADSVLSQDITENDTVKTEDTHADGDKTEGGEAE